MLIGIDASRGNRKYKSGTEWYSYYIIRALASVDTDNTYILYTDRPLEGGMADLRPQGDEQASAPPVAKNGEQIILSPHGNFSARVLSWPWKFFWTQGRLSLEMLWRKPDVLFIPSHALPIIHPRRSVVTIHDIGFRRDETLYDRKRIGAQGGWRYRLVNRLVRLLSWGRYGATSYDHLEWSTRYALQHAQSIIAISDFTKKELISAYAADVHKLVVIPHGYNDALFKELPDDDHSKEVLARYGITQPYIYYVGRLEKKKNTLALVEAFGRLKEKAGSQFKHKLYLIGTASYGFDEIKYTIHQYGLENDVIVTGWIPEHDLAYISARADAFVFPSNYEGFGIPLLQAMATKTPIASSTAASLPEVAGDAAVMFDPSNIEEMANALEVVLFNEEERSRLRQAGSIRVKTYNWTITANATKQLLEKVASQRPTEGV